MGTTWIKSVASNMTVWRPNGQLKIHIISAYLLVELPLRCEAILAGGGLADEFPVLALAPRQHRYFR